MRFVGLRLGGVGGFTNDGEVGAEEVEGPGFGAATGKAAVLAGRVKPKELEVLTAKPFKLRGFFAGVVGRCNSKNWGSCEPDLAFSLATAALDRRSGTQDDCGVLEAGDAGDGPGDGSVMEEPSIVEMVVVGEESVESDEVEVLPRCW